MIYNSLKVGLGYRLDSLSEYEVSKRNTAVMVTYVILLHTSGHYRYAVTETRMERNHCVSVNVVCFQSISIFDNSRIYLLLLVSTSNPFA